MMMTGVILAAGTSSRMGQNKLLLKYRHHTVIEETLRQVVNSLVDSVVVITGHEADRIETVVKKFPYDRITTIHNDQYLLGRAASIKCAIRHLDKQAEAVLFMVADKPEVSTGLIDRAIAGFDQSRPAILYVKTPAGRGHPIIFSHRLFPELLLLNGDCIGKALVAKYAAEAIEIPDRKVQRDIDTPEDYKQLRKRMNGNE